MAEVGVARGLLRRPAWWHNSLSHAVTFLYSELSGAARRGSAPRDISTNAYWKRFSATRKARAPPRARSPNNAIRGNRLAVAGSVFSSAIIGAASTTGAAATSVSAGGGVTTSASCTSSPVGLTAMIGALLNCATIGASTDLIGSATSRGSSTGVYRTGVLEALASIIALAFG